MSSANEPPAPPSNGAPPRFTLSPEPASPEPRSETNEVSLSERIRALKERVKTIRDGTLLMRSAVLNPEPGKRYLWVGVHQDRRTFFEAIGWTVVRNPDKTRRSYDPALQEHRRGDVVLYQIDEEEADAIEKYNIVRGLEAAGQDVETGFAAAVERHGVKAFRPPV